MSDRIATRAFGSFSLDAELRTAVTIGRRIVGLPYNLADMAVQRDGDRVAYRSSAARANGERAVFVARTEVDGTPSPGEPGSFERWMAERYSFFGARRTRVVQGRVEHDPWPLSPARVTIEENTLLRDITGGTPGEFRAHFSEGVRVRAYPWSVVMPAA